MLPHVLPHPSLQRLPLPTPRLRLLRLTVPRLPRPPRPRCPSCPSVRDVRAVRVVRLSVCPSVHLSACTSRRPGDHVWLLLAFGGASPVGIARASAGRAALSTPQNERGAPPRAVSESAQSDCSDRALHIPSRAIFIDQNKERMQMKRRTALEGTGIACAYGMRSSARGGAEHSAS